ncbi:hypothetical protein BDV97DRAFT_365830 [Delphinella strobiligena]|nr:hypothetical protein BDV97DRAFT_365830 [Delphinella strobiligena]
MSTNNIVQTDRSVLSDRSQAIPDSPSPTYHLAVATEDLPAYDGAQLPTYASTTRSDMLQAGHIPASGMVRLIVTRSETVTRTIGPLARDLELLRRHTGNEIEILFRITEMRRTLELLRAAANQRVAAAQTLADRIRVYEECIAALPESSDEVARANQ